MTLAAHAANAIPLAEHPDEPQDILGVVLEVAVHGDDALTSRQAKAGGKGRCLPKVFPEMGNANPRVGLLLALEFGESPILAAIIYENVLEAAGPRVQDAAGFLEQRTDVLHFVVNRDDDAQG
jgi:hypothetical protein